MRLSKKYSLSFSAVTVHKNHAKATANMAKRLPAIAENRRDMKLFSDP
jgi:hypothetical protein